MLVFKLVQVVEQIAFSKHQSSSLAILTKNDEKSDEPTSTIRLWKYHRSGADTNTDQIFQMTEDKVIDSKNSRRKSSRHKPPAVFAWHPTMKCLVTLGRVTDI